jgi:hypothetical protein
VSWKLFVDDDAHGMRRPSLTVENPAWRASMNLPAVPPETSHLGEWVVALDAAAAISIIEARGVPAFVSFDHDLGDGRDAMAVVRHMIEVDMERAAIPDGFSYEVHSANPVGRANITGLLDGYLAFRQANGTMS